MSITIVTGLWDIQRSELKKGWARTYEHYINKLIEILPMKNNMIIFGDKDLKEIVFTYRKEKNTLFVERPLTWFKNEFFDTIQEIRKSNDWLSLAPWLKDSTQGSLEYYNPLVMSKPFLLNDARILDKFDSTHLFWLDAGITNTVNSGYFINDNVIDKLGFIDKLSFIAFPYKAANEIHGFEFKKLCELSGSKVDKVCRGGFFGGTKENIANFNGEYYNLMSETLSQKYMGTEESLFTILTYKNPYNYNYFDIGQDGLIYRFFEDIKNNTYKVKNQKLINKHIDLDINNCALYILTFNSPKQVETLLLSMKKYDVNFINKPKIFLLNNSTDKDTDPKYDEICKEHNITQIKKDNLGICGGRQFIAEHAEDNGFDYYFFFEDDMFLHPVVGSKCKNGFTRFEPNLYNKIMKIINKNGFDFLKLSYTEFYGDNGTQFSWYNVPQHIRGKLWPNNKELPKRGLSPSAPKTKFNNILSDDGIPYATGEIYYSNWPQVVSRYGNEKMFLMDKWAHPYEQTWMSYIFQKTLDNDINPAILLMSPIEHDRFDHYDGKLRKES